MKEKSRELYSVLSDEMNHHIKGGIYNKLQVDFAYNSNHIEGSTLTHEQTRYIYETNTVGIEPARVDDVIETVNHFRCFDYILRTVNTPLSAEYIRELHRILKTSTLSSDSDIAVVGDYKKYPNTVGEMETTPPEKVEKAIDELLAAYESIDYPSFDDLLDFHASYEKIHPFYDGNGRTGRLLLFKECLRNKIVPFVIEDTYKGEYYRGLREWQSGGEKGYLRDTCLLMQDHMKEVMAYSDSSHTPQRVAAPPVYASYFEKKQGDYTLEDYYALPDDLRVELIDGVIFYMDAPTATHQLLAAEIHGQIAEFIKKSKGPCVPFIAPTDVRLDGEEDDRTMVQPDVLIVCDRSKIIGRYIVGAPDFVAEVLSKSTRKKDMTKKLQKYSDAGVREYWIIDPDGHVITYDLEHDCRISLYSLNDKVPVAIYDGNLVIDFENMPEYVKAFL